TDPLQIFAGVKNSPGLKDDILLQAQFDVPLGIGVNESNGIIYVADTINQAIRQIDSQSNKVTTLITAADARAAGSVSAFGARGVAVDKDGSLFISDAVNNVVWFFNTSSRTLKLLAGTPGQKGLVDGNGGTARFNNPQGVQMDNAQRN